MTQADYRSARSTVQPHDHAVFVYHDETELLSPLDTFLREGVRNRELTTFVHSFESARNAHRFLATKIPDLPAREEQKDLVLAHHKDAFELAGRIDHRHIEGVVGMLHQSAHATHRGGVRIFVDASRRYLSAGRTEEWFALESWLGPRLQADVGLVCAYEARHLEDPAVLSRVLQTHAYRFAAPGTPIR